MIKILLPAIRKIIILLLCSITFITSAQAGSVNIADSHGKIYVLKSPDGKTIIQFGLNDQRQLMYKMNFKNRPVTNWSALGLECTSINLSRNITISGKNETNVKETFDWPLGEDARIENIYHEIILHCKSDNARFDVMVRFIHSKPLNLRQG